MTVDEVRAIREKKSLETIGMTTEELSSYFSKGASEIQRMVDKIRKESSTLTPTICVHQDYSTHTN